jgi:hypothetical protein
MLLYNPFRGIDDGPADQLWHAPIGEDTCVQEDALQLAVGIGHRRLTGISRK